MIESKYCNRRSFIKQSILVAAATGTASLTSFALSKDDEVKLTILHTNDVHSQVDPFEMDGSSLQGLGGTARRSTLLKKIRTEEEHVLLFDAGDIFQGTPYFNLFDGQVELELMSKMGYDAGTFGNHEFDNGIQEILKHFDKANFPFLISNYDFSNTELSNKTKDYEIFERDGLKIGVFGLGIDLKGLVDPTKHRGLIFKNPIETAINTSNHLKENLNCDLIVCLSHLGYSYQDNKISDIVLAKNTRYIDFIIGGHTHTFLERPTEVKNLLGKKTLINQVGRSGVILGRIDFFINSFNKSMRYVSKNYLVDHHLQMDDLMRIG